MKKILFRGKRVDNGEWVYGNLINWNPKLNPRIVWCEYCEIDEYIETNYEIEIDSLGQFTGLKDKNGVEIYDGDKVKFHYFYQGYINGGAIECEKEIDSVIEIRELGLFLKCENEDEGGYLLFYQPHEESFEIIGNIHEDESV